MSVGTRTRQKTFTGAIPKRDRGHSIVVARKAEAALGIALAFAGLLAAIGMLGCDVWYSYTPAAKITSAYFAVFLSVVTTPIEFIGLSLLGRREQKKDMDSTMRWFWYAILPIALIYDIATNIAGLQQEAMVINMVDEQWMWAFSIGVGASLAMIEYLIVGSLRVLSMKSSEYKVASQWLAEWEEAHDEGREVETDIQRGRW